MTSVDSKKMDLSNDENETLPAHQTERAREDQVLNHAGGYVFQVDDMVRALRFLILGTEGGTYYQKQQALSLENAKALKALVDAGRGQELVDLIRSVSVKGRAARQEPTLFALALCAKLGDEPTRHKAFQVLDEVCRIPTHLFMFLEFCVAFVQGKGFGRAQQRAIAQWYNNKAITNLAFTVTKYKQRNNWHHRDVLRLGHVKPVDAAHNAIYLYLTKGKEAFADQTLKEDQAAARVLEFFADLESLNQPGRTIEQVMAMVEKHQLAREHVPTQFLQYPKLWLTMLPKMPLTAMIRNLATMSRIGVLPGITVGQAWQPPSPRVTHSRRASKVAKKHSSLHDVAKQMGEAKQQDEKQAKQEAKRKEKQLTPQQQQDAKALVCKKLNDRDALRKARIHPYNVLLALHTYKSGHGFLSRASWTPDKDVVAALDAAFEASFANVEPTGQRYMLALDVSGSMTSRMRNGPLSVRVAASAMAVITLRTEEHVSVVAFSDELMPLDIPRGASVQDVVKMTEDLPFSATDCALPMLYAMEREMDVDVFVVYTDNETYFGSVHPYQALCNYRKAMSKPEAKLIVVGMTSTQFTIADPKDPFMMDVVGFDADAPLMMAAFARGELSSI
eukprot:m.18968 g.18968  ORF g.18968 m.18968 type:complete len:618 (-) comp8596_c0_seq1:1148-3001(-)